MYIFITQDNKWHNVKNPLKDIGVVDISIADGNAVSLSKKIESKIQNQMHIFTSEKNQKCVQSTQMPSPSTPTPLSTSMKHKICPHTKFQVAIIIGKMKSTSYKNHNRNISLNQKSVTYETL